jgi:dsRNA-specific ribonuclease
VLRDAWIGDAVLALYVRTKILREDGVVDGEKYTRMTSNQFLNGLGEPSEVEARIGRVYEAEGLRAAFSVIEAEILPLFEKQEANRVRKQR